MALWGSQPNSKMPCRPKFPKILRPRWAPLAAGGCLGLLHVPGQRALHHQHWHPVRGARRPEDTGLPAEVGADGHWGRRRPWGVTWRHIECQLAPLAQRKRWQKGSGPVRPGGVAAFLLLEINTPFNVTRSRTTRAATSREQNSLFGIKENGQKWMSHM